MNLGSFSPNGHGIEAERPNVTRLNRLSPLLATGGGDVRIQPVAGPIPLPDRLKAIGLVALTGALGVGVVWGGRLIWNAPEEALAPLPQEAENPPEQTPLRKRVQVIKPGATPIRPPESSPLLAPTSTPAQPNSRSRQATEPPATHTSHGFANSGQALSIEPPPVPVAMTLPAVPAAAQPAAEAAPSNIQAVPPSSSVAKLPPQPVAKPAPARSFPSELIAALLQAPSPNGDGMAGNVAIAPLPSTVVRQPARSTPLPSSPTQSGIAPPTRAQATGVPTKAWSPLAPTARPPAAPPIAPPATAATGAPPTTDALPRIAIKPEPLKESIDVDRLNITGSTRFSSTELAAAVQTAISSNGKAPEDDPTVIKRKLSPAELVQASGAITKLYTDRGYITSGAYVPAEVLNGAPPEIRVVEGKLQTINVKIESPKFLGLGQRLSQDYVRHRLARWIRLPLEINQLADAVKLLEQDPLIESIKTELAPGTTTGSSVLNVTAKQAPPLHITGTVDNGRAPSVGRLRQQVSLSQANLLGLGDRLQVGLNRSAGSRGVDLSYAIPVNASNGTLSFLYSNNRGQVVEQPFQDLDIKSRSQSYEIGFRQPLLQTSTEEFALSLRGTHYRNEGVFLETLNEGTAIPFPSRGSDSNGVTKITALRFGQAWVKRGERDVISLQSEFNLGLTALGATKLDQLPDGRFFSWQGRGFWVHSLAPDTLVVLKGQLQFADRPLVPVEQISLGGVDTVRGYRTGVLLADNAWFASAEMYLPVLRIPKWRSVVQVVPFVDLARGWNRGDEKPAPGSLASTGLGLQWKIGDNFRARVDWGIPLINTTAGNGQSLRENLFFSIQFSP